MNSDTDDTIREIVTDVEDLKTNVEELRVDPPEGVAPASLKRLEKALEHAVEVADELEEQEEAT